jgi:hypothetical protein
MRIIPQIFMLTLSLVSLLIFAANLALLGAGVTMRSLLRGSLVLAVLITSAFSLKPYFGLGPHIEVPGWVVGLIISGLSLLTSLLAVVAWRLFGANRKNDPRP